MPITILNDGIKVNAPRAYDMRYGKLSAGKTVPYATKAEALAAVISEYRHIGLTVNIAGDEWWFKDSISDEGLIRKFTAGQAFQFEVKAEHVGNNGVSIPILAGYQFTLRRDIAGLFYGVDYTIYPGGGFEMINAEDVFVLGQRFELIIVTSITVL